MVEGLKVFINYQRFIDVRFNSKHKLYRINSTAACNDHCAATNNRIILEYLNADREHSGLV